jgi:hypothetical protein
MGVNISRRRSHRRLSTTSMMPTWIDSLLPCNLVVHTDPGDTATVIVEAMDPSVLPEVFARRVLQPIADEVTANCGPRSICWTPQSGRSRRRE